MESVMSKWLLLLAVIAVPVFGQEAPHKFWDRREQITFAATLGIRAADAASTCYNLSAHRARLVVFSNGSSVMVPQQWSEEWLPVKSCAGVAAWIGGGQIAQTAVQYALHRRGHHKLERLVPLFWTAPNAAGIGWTFTH